MLEIKIADEVHGKDIADFQCRMAMQTQNLKLDKEMVEQAVAYLLKHKQFGQYFIPVEPSSPEKAQGSFLITYQNNESWWIQSVYVKQQHRRKGVFTSLFKAAGEKGKQSDAKSLQLYVQKQNKRAIQTYQKLGMYCNGYQFCGYELVYGHTGVIKDLQSPFDESLKVETMLPNQQFQTQHNLMRIAGKKSNKNRNLKCTLNNEVIGNCEYFYEFSDWRFGLIIYINYFACLLEHAPTCLQAFLKYVFQNCELKVGAIRILATPQEIKKIRQLIPSIHEDVYFVMQIDL